MKPKPPPAPVDPYDLKSEQHYHARDWRLASPVQIATSLDLRLDWVLAEAKAGRLPHTVCADRIWFDRSAVADVIVAQARATVAAVRARIAKAAEVEA